MRVIAEHLPVDGTRWTLTCWPDLAPPLDETATGGRSSDPSAILAKNYDTYVSIN